MCRGGTQPARGRDRASRGVGLPSHLLPGPPSSLTAGLWATGDTFAQRRSEEEAPVSSHVLPLPIWSSRPPRPRHGEDAQVRGAPRPGSGQFPGSRLARRCIDLPTAPHPVPRAGAQPSGAPAASQHTWQRGGSWKPSEPGGLWAGPSSGPRNPRRALGPGGPPLTWPGDQFTSGGT